MADKKKILNDIVGFKDDLFGDDGMKYDISVSADKSLVYTIGTLLVISAVLVTSSILLLRK